MLSLSWVHRALMVLLVLIPESEFGNVLDEIGKCSGGRKSISFLDHSEKLDMIC